MYLLLKRIKISVDVWLRVSCQEICRCLFASSESIPPLSIVDITHVDLGKINGNKAQPALDGSGPSAASPGESGHVVGFLLCGLDEAQKLEF